MIAVILAGGLGTRLSEETEVKPKPMVEIGQKPILWHIMKIYSEYGINDFIICCGYKGYVIKEYFSNYSLYMSDITLSLNNDNIKVYHSKAEPWNIKLIDTGADSMTGGRLKRVSKYLKNENAFCFTYGDGLANINISDLISFHFSHGKLATITATIPPARFGALKLGRGNIVESFQEKVDGDDNWVNGGFFVLNPDIINHIKGDHSIFESDVLTELAKKNQLVAYKHSGFWQPMDTLREKNLLNELWSKGTAPWKTWN
jgi:glucose-1-phosphate cytidylyltransferase